MKSTTTPTINSDVNIAANIAASRAVREILDECVPLVLGAGVDEDRFWELLATEAAGRLGMVLAPDGPAANNRPMTCQEARDFELKVMPWGAQAGRRVGEIEPRYFLAITEGAFPRQLQRYLRSARFLERQAE